METDLKDGMCRCCASEGSYKDFTASYQWMGVEEVYADMLKDCFDVTLSTSSTVSNGGICEVCITQLRNAFNFKKQVLNTEEQFKKLQENIVKADIVKVELPHDDMETSDVGGNMDDDFSGPEYDIPIKSIKIEKAEEAKTKKRTARASTSKAKKPKADVGESSAKRNVTTSHNKIKLKDSTSSDVFEQVVNIKIELEEVDPLSDTEDSVPLKAFQDENRSVEIEGVPQEVNNERENLDLPQSTNIDKKEEKNRQKEEIMKHWHNINEILQCSNATLIRSYGDKGYLCGYCDQYYLNPADLKIHTLRSHNGIKDVYFTKKIDLKNYHVKLDITNLQCSVCDKDIDNLSEIILHLIYNHQKTYNSDIKNYIVPFKFDSDELYCFICKAKFSIFKMLVAHMNSHTRNFICNICDAGFITPKRLQDHLENHKTLPVFKCDYCEKVFSTKKKRYSHVEGVHIKKNGFKCSVCGEEFPTARKRLYHLANDHGVKELTRKCDVCDKVFPNSDSLRNHTRRDHLLERRFECTVCEMKFFLAKDLKLHMVKHTGVKQFKCEVCQKAYGWQKALREHMRIHEDDRRFNCEYCSQTFIYKSSWRRHVRTKHEENDT